MLRDTIISTIRRVFCQALAPVTAEQTKMAIEQDISLVQSCNDQIGGISSKIPHFLLSAGKHQLDAYLLEQNTTVTALTLMWLKEDRPDLFVAIMKTHGGIPWFNNQVNSILQSVL